MYDLCNMMMCNGHKIPKTRFECYKQAFTGERYVDKIIRLFMNLIITSLCDTLYLTDLSDPASQNKFSKETPNQCPDDRFFLRMQIIWTYSMMRWCNLSKKRSAMWMIWRLRIRIS